ncbi:MAG: radical SAM protein [Spirochaetales bacterium]|nr:radical SAM protein [Spirochaetales bacterium]
MDLTERFRSHHDAERRLGNILKIEPHSRRSVVEWEAARTDLDGMTPPKERCVYLHVPFCDSICSFCNLNRKMGLEPEVAAYGDFLVEEIRKYAALPYVQKEEFRAVYFGGGTPTILDKVSLKKVIDALHTYLPLAEDCEMTMESTLHNLPPSKVAFLQDLGVNRLSLGIQSFSDRGREVLNRTGKGEFCIDRIGEFREIFHGILGVDIIYSYPEQKREEVLRDAELVYGLGIDGVSFYSLMIHEGSVLGGKIKNGTIEFDRSLDQDLANHNAFYQYLHGKGYEMLELSKLVRPGRDEYRYIKIRYANGDVLPLGNGAGGRLGPYRVYQRGPGMTMVSPINSSYDHLHHILGFLQYGSYNGDTLLPLLNHVEETELIRTLDRYRRGGLLELKNERYNLTPDGVFWGNNLAVDLIETFSQQILKKGVPAYAY